MAEALPVELSIPCEVCHRQIYANDWNTHARTCGEKGNNPTQANDDDERETPVTPNIPCEFCETSIPFSEFDRHTKRCAESYRHENERRQTTTGPASSAVMIPCEFCHDSFDMHNLEWHSSQCPQRFPSNTNTTNIGVPSPDVSIPCEYCTQLISFYGFDQHTIKCAEEDRQRRENLYRSSVEAVSNDLIPCEICGMGFPVTILREHQTECQRQQQATVPFLPPEHTFGTTIFPDTWDLMSYESVTRHILIPGTKEYKDVETRFKESLPSSTIIQIERIQNRRWYRQYDAHKDDFIERYGRSTEQWLFHGCKGPSTELIIKDCFNRSHATRCAVGQGIYFAAQSATSLSYTQPDADNNRHMFMARVLVGKTTTGNASTRVCPPGFDTTGGGNVYVTYHDAQAYAEYLITFQ